MVNTCSICKNVLDTRIIRDVAAGDTVYDVYFCKECKVGVVVPTPLQEDLARLYASESYRSVTGSRFNPIVESFIYLSRTRRRKRVEKYVSRGNILDIGCGRGLFLAIMRRNGWAVAGVEFSPEWAAAVSRIHDIPVVSGEPPEWAFQDGSFDVITMNHVLEHLLRPAEMVGECNRLLRKGGLLVCALPNIASLQASAGKAGWFHLDIPYHIHQFSEDGLVKLLEKHLFRIVRIRRHDLEHNPFGWLQTLLNISGIRNNYLYGLLKKQELGKRELSGARLRDFLLTLVLLPLYLPLSLLLSVFESFALKRGGTVEVFAIKE
jgi:2-polyprenyl-3-methyl-5-hydroxy-6-metoxy-1,4-benzoquinol methylase